YFPGQEKDGVYTAHLCKYRYSLFAGIGPIKQLPAACKGARKSYGLSIVMHYQRLPGFEGCSIYMTKNTWGHTAFLYRPCYGACHQCAGFGMSRMRFYHDRASCG